MKYIDNLTSPNTSDDVILNNYDVSKMDILSVEILAPYGQWRNVQYAYHNTAIYTIGLPEGTAYRNRPCRVKYLQK